MSSLAGRTRRCVFFQAEDGIRDWSVTGVQTCALPILPMLDRGLTALVDDLHQRGLDRDVSVVCWGEFGRTPKINKEVGRDHWPPVACALLACGGMRTGQVIGSTDPQAGHTKDRPAKFPGGVATAYRKT